MEPQNFQGQNINNKDTTTVKDTDMAFYIARKSEKLTSAIYRVTESLEHEEPIKWVLREKSLQCMLSCMSFSRSHTTLRHNLYKTVILLIDEISTMLEVSFTNSLVSQMNFSILNDEYKGLRNNLENYKNKNLKPIDLGVALLEEKREEQEIEKDITTSQQRYFKIAEGSEPQNSAQEKVEYKRQFKRQELQKPSRTPKSKAVVQGDKAKRRELIIEYIKKNGEVSVKDIFSIPEFSNNYSEKTIQRELVDMVEKGVLKKKGERRWSKYYL